MQDQKVIKVCRFYKPGVRTKSLFNCLHSHFPTQCRSRPPSRRRLRFAKCPISPARTIAAYISGILYIICASIISYPSPTVVPINISVTITRMNERDKYHYVKAQVQVLHHLDGILSILHGPRRLARYGVDGSPLPELQPKVVACERIKKADSSIC
jgi:hypothetical protein